MREMGHETYLADFCSLLKVVVSLHVHVQPPPERENSLVDSRQFPSSSPLAFCAVRKAKRAISREAACWENLRWWRLSSLYSEKSRDKTRILRIKPLPPLTLIVFGGWSCERIRSVTSFAECDVSCCHTRSEHLLLVATCFAMYKALPKNGP